VTTRLAVWSGPRNISTALMRSWENRSDTAVVDEPLYAYYLARTGIDHPAREKVIASQSTDLAVVTGALLGPAPGGAAVFYQKHMTLHLLEDTDRQWIPKLRNVLVIRDPAEVVASYRRTREDVVASDIGVEQQHRLYSDLVAAHELPPIIDAGDFLREPEGYLRWLCDWVAVDFDPAMLSWPAGPRDTDGVWAPHWYASVLASTGFEPLRERTIDLDDRSAAVVESVRPSYDDLRSRRIRL
jgi:Sulfotransferase domain